MKKQTNRNKMTAVQFQRSFDATLDLMEAIGESTRQSLVESQTASFAAESEYTQEGKVIVENMFQVSVADGHDENGMRKEPELWSEPVEELDEHTKGQIVEKLAEQLMKMKDEVIDFNQIGPVATVIQSQLGIRQPLDGFITQLIDGAAYNQDSQAFAHNWQEIPGVKEAGVTPEELKTPESPTDIEPPVAPIENTGTPGEVKPMGDEGSAAPATASVTEINIVRPDEGAGIEDLGLSGEEIPSSDELPVGGEPAAAIGAGDGEVEDLGLGGDDVPAFNDDQVGGVSEEEPTPIDAEVGGQQTGEDEDEDEEDELNFKLESIANEFRYKNGDMSKEQFVQAQLESLRAHTANTLVEAVDPEVKLDSMLESIISQYQSKVQEEAKSSNLKAQLESIASSYHTAVEKRTKKNMLESIALDYKKKQEALAESRIENKLKSLVESYQTEQSVSREMEALAEAYQASITQKSKVTATLESIAANYKAKESAADKIQAQLESIAASYHKKETLQESSEESLHSKLNALVESYHSASPAREATRQRLQQLQS